MQNRIIQHTVRTFGTLCVLMLFSCGGVQCGLSPEAVEKRGIKPGEGWIVGSFHTHSANHGKKEWDPLIAQNVTDGGSSLLAHQVKQEGQLQISISNFWTKDPPSLLGRPRTGECFAIPVPAGNYEITGAVINPGVGEELVFKNRSPLKVPFHVNAGEATDIGSIHVNVLYEQAGLLGMSHPTEGAILVSDDHDKNVTLIRRTFPLISKVRITRSDVPNRYMLDLKRIAETRKSWWQY